MAESRLICFGQIAGSVVHVIENFNVQLKEMNQKRSSLDKFCRDHELPADLKRKLNDHLEVLCCLCSRFLFSLMVLSSQFSFHNSDAANTVSYELDSLLDDLGQYLIRNSVSSFNMLVNDGRTSAAYRNHAVLTP